MATARKLFVILVPIVAVVATAEAQPPTGTEAFARRCSLVTLAATSAATITDRSDAPPAVCSADYGPIRRSVAGSVTETRVLLLRFSLLGSALPGRAWLRFPEAAAVSADGLSVAADWYPWGTCDAGDLTANGNGIALDIDGACGDACRLNSVENGFDLELDNVADHIDFSGDIDLRVTLSAEPVTGDNSLTLAAAPPLAEAYLLVEVCEDEVPVPEACAVLQFPTDAEAVTLAQAIDEAPVPLVCTDDVGESTLLAASIELMEGASVIRQAANSLLAFDTGTLPVGHVPYLARVRMRVMGHHAPTEGSGTLAGDWQPWGPTCDLADHAGSGPADALSAFTAGVCGYSCTVADLPLGSLLDFPLLDPATHLNPNGVSEVRLRIAADSGTNLLRVSNSAVPGSGPELLVLACEDPTPDLPAPPPGCAYHRLPAPLDSASVVANTPAGEPTQFQCVDDSASASVPQLLVADTYDVDGRNTVTGNMLLRWDTSSLPLGATIDGAWLRLFVADYLTEPGAVLTADWDPWGQCDSADVTRAPVAVALSTGGACGTACEVGTLAAAAYVDLPLDAAAANIARGAGAATDLRLRVIADAASGQSWLAASDSTTMLKGPGLLVLTCDAEPPPPAATDAIIAWGIVDGQVAVTGKPGSVEGGAEVTITNLRTGQQVAVTANADGSFVAPLLAVAERDALALVVTDPSGNASPAAALQVLPPDPALVAPALDRTVATTVADSTAFLYTDPLAVQVGVAPGTIEPVRAAVLRGTVRDRDGDPLPGVRVSVLDHPEYGYTLSRADGGFDVAVNGGVTLTVEYAGVDALPAQRTIAVPWQDTAHLPAVALVAPSATATVVTFAAGAPAQTVLGGVESDASGSREAALLVPADTAAEFVMPDGSRLPVTAPLTVRLTEYTVGPRGPEAMPGELPPTSAYTYAVEVGADEALTAGAVRIDFAQPVPLYVDNFIGFPTGLAVPAGAYDRATAQWVPQPNGVVLRVTSVAGGVASIDTTGDGVPESDAVLLGTHGISVAERQQLATRYAGGLPVGGASLWRVALAFSSRWDCNWPGGAPADAVAPNGGLPSGGLGESRLDDPDTSADGEIAFQNQTLRQRVALPGTPYALTYDSGRQVDARLQPISIPVTGAALPASLDRVEVVVEVAGRQFRETITAPALAPGLSRVFPSAAMPWDGTDVYGRVLQGRTAIDVAILFVYPRAYTQPAANDARAFGRVSGLAIPGLTIDDRAEIAIGTRFRGVIGGWDSQAIGLGGWALDVHHSYDPASGMLASGAGAQRSREHLDASLETVIGGGSVWPVVDGVTRGPEVHLVAPAGVAVDADGRVYVADPGVGRNQILRRNTDGTMTRIAGGGRSLADGVAATAARVNPRGLAIGPDGSLYFTEYPGSGTDPHRVRRIDLTTGLVTTVAGDGTKCPSSSAPCGDGGPALAAFFDRPGAVQVAADGTLYIADRGNRVRVVGADGDIRLLASGFFNPPELDLALGRDGSLYVAGGSGKVRRIAPDGLLSDFAGSGVDGTDDGDGLAALAAKFVDIDGLALGADGSLYVADSDFHRVRRVGPDGIVRAAVGKRQALNTAPPYQATDETGPAPAAALASPIRLAVGPDDSLYVVDEGHARVRRVRSPLPGFAALGDTVIASADGSELYVFDSRGRHLRTVDALTSAVRQQFSYDAAGRLAGVTDVDGRQLTLTRPSASTVVLTGPDGQATTLTLDANGYVASIATSAGTTTIASGAQGLIGAITDANAHTRTFTYTGDGRLETAADPPGADGSDTLVRSALAVPDGSGYQVTTPPPTACRPGTRWSSCPPAPSGARRSTPTARSR